MTYALIGIGLAAGVLSGLFGVGGGIILVPSMIFFLGFAPLAASGTSLVAMLLPVGALGVWQYYQAGKIGNEHLYFGLWIALGMFVGAFLGGKLAIVLPIEIMKKLFSGLLVVAAWKLWSS